MTKTGIDLVKQEVESISLRISECLKIDRKLMRMDSFMISSSCKKLSRIELTYSVNHAMVKTLKKLVPDAIPESCKAYLEKGHKNDTIYRTRDVDAGSKLEMLFKHTEMLYEAAINAGGEVTASKAFSILARFIQEQTTIEENGRVLKPGSELSSKSLQNPSDPDATYRKKYGNNTGYVANVVNAYDGENQVITDYALEPNIYSDQKFTKDTIENLSQNQDSAEKRTLNVDGTYYTDELSKEAKEQNIDLIPGQLTGAKPNPEKLGYDQFEVEEKKQKVVKCPAGHTPDESYYDEKKKTYTVKMNKEICNACPFREKCPIKQQKKKNVARFSEKRYHNDQVRAQMKTEEYQELTNSRAGVEGIPSVMRRRYNVDHMPIRGLVRSKIWFGFKIVAMNFKSLVKGLREMEQNYFVCLWSKLKSKILKFSGVITLNTNNPGATDLDYLLFVV